jgi:hypothetical protein
MVGISIRQNLLDTYVLGTAKIKATIVTKRRYGRFQSKRDSESRSIATSSLF